MRDTIFVHDLGATELKIGCVNFPAQDLIQCGRASEDNRLAFDLYCALTETDEISTNTDRASSNECNGKYIVIRPGGLTRDQTRALQALDTKTVLQTDNVGDLEASLAIFLNLFGEYRGATLLVELEMSLRSEIEVADTFLWLVWFIPRAGEETDDLV